MNTSYNNRIPKYPVIVKAGLYTRVSSQEQAQHGVSLAEQKERLEAWAKIEGWEVAEFYTDDGYTGGNDNRPDLQRLMSDARAGLFNIVAVTKIDRFFRNTRQLLNYIHELESNGVTFVAQAEGIDTSKPGMGKVILSMLGSVAEWERERIGNRVSDFRQHLAKKGQWSSGRTPFGYRFDKGTKELVTDPLEVEAVKFIFETYTGKQIGIIRCAELANKEGIITPRGGRRKHTTWTQSAIRHILTHPAYKGGPSDDWQFKTPAIVTTELWEQAQRQLAGNRHFREAESHNPFTGLLRCGLCGHTLRVGYNHNTHTVWECPGRLKRLHLDGSPHCELPRSDSFEMEANLAYFLSELFTDENKLKDYVNATIRNLEKEHKQVERRVSPIRDNIERCKLAMEKADTMYEMNRLTRDDYRARISGLRKRIKALEYQVSDADPLLIRQLTQIEDAIAFYNGLTIEIPQAMTKIEGAIERAFPDKLPDESDDDISEHDLEGMACVMVAAEGFGIKADSFTETVKQLSGKIAEYMRKIGLYAYIYPEDIEIKGAIRQTNISNSCSKNINIPLSITLPGVKL